MNLEKLPVEELELMSYTDLTYEILKESNKPLNTPTIFKKICDLLGFDDGEYAEKIGDYYTSLTTDKRFVLLDSNEWDIRDNHSISIDLDEDDEEEETEEENQETEEDDYSDESEEENIDEVLDDELDDSDLDDLVVVDEEELEE